MRTTVTNLPFPGATNSTFPALASCCARVGPALGTQAGQAIARSLAAPSSNTASKHGKARRVLGGRRFGFDPAHEPYAPRL
jgi:hypothetical protein